jgi:hypothetical protein
MKKILIIAGIVFLFILQLMVGYIRESYVINTHVKEQPLLIERYSSGTEEYPMKTAEVSKAITGNPKWISTSLYSIFFLVSSSIIVFLIFRTKKAVYFCLSAYTIIFMLAGVFVVISFLFNNYKVGYGLAQNLKNLSQSPLVVIGLVPVYKLLEGSGLKG